MGKEMKTYRVCMVEDHAATARRLAEMFEGVPDFELVGRFGDGDEALREIPALRPDLILMDLQLPGMGGVECIGRLRRVEKLSDARIVVLTTFEEEDSILECFHNGANGYLLKGGSPDLLLAELRVACLGGASMSQSIAGRILRDFESSTPDASNPLTARETEVINLLSLGLTYKGIGEEMEVSHHTVRRHIEKIYRKLGVNSRTQAILRGKRFGLFRDDH